MQLNSPIPREPCPYCGIDAVFGPYAHTDRMGCVNELKNRHVSHQRRISSFVTNHIEEVHNQIGGVIGYVLHLNAEETGQLFRIIEDR